MMYEADYGTKNAQGEIVGRAAHVIVCQRHLEEHGDELIVWGENAERINCYFCRGGQ